MGGGGSKTSNTTDVINTMVNENIVKATTNCESGIIGEQYIELGGEGNVYKNISQVAKSKMSMDCLSSDTFKDDFVTKFVNDAKGKIDNISPSIMGKIEIGNQDELKTRIENDVKNIFENDFSSRLSGNITSNQTIKGFGKDNVSINVSQENNMESTNKIIRELLQEKSIMNDFTNQVDNAIKKETEDTVAKVSETIGDTVSDIANAIAGGVMIWILIIGAVFIGIIFLIYKFVAGSATLLSDEEFRKDLGSAAQYGVTQAREIQKEMK